MGYSPGFLRGILSLVTIAAGVGMIAALANELLDLGLFERGYPGGSGFGGFVLAMAAVLAVSWALGVLTDRLDR
jgi:hypothetical protein